MANYQLTNKADDDLVQIYGYGIENFGLIHAQTYLASLADRFEYLANQPEFGRTADELFPGLRRSAIEKHVIFYVMEDDGILIVRVLREEMDFARHL